MGLDWVLNDKSKEGVEERVNELRLLIENFDGPEDAYDYKCMLKELKSLVVTPFETCGCKRIGIDREADEWIRKRNPDVSDEELKEEYGKYIPLCEKGAIPIYEAGTGPFDFRGKLVGTCSYLSRELREEAYRDMSCVEMMDYSDRLNYELEYILRSTTEFDDTERDLEINILRNAISWLRYWSMKGHGMSAWY